jgi:hypothetical protein
VSYVVKSRIQTTETHAIRRRASVALASFMAKDGTVLSVGVNGHGRG